jgi:hypothetical protein
VIRGYLLDDLAADLIRTAVPDVSDDRRGFGKVYDH